MMAVLARMKERQLLEESDCDSEDDYYYQFPTTKRSASKGRVEKKTGIKRKASAAMLCSSTKTRVSRLTQCKFSMYMYSSTAYNDLGGTEAMVRYIQSLL